MRGLHIAVDEVFAAVHHPLLPLLPREDLQAVLSLLRHLDGTHKFSDDVLQFRGLGASIYDVCTKRRGS